jgi:transposase
MLKKTKGQLDMFVDFTFVYDMLNEQYNTIGRGSKDSVMMIKILMFEYLNNLSDVKVAERIQTDVVFRWFLDLGLNDIVPDDTTISHFRVNR